jgi:hypothetical protein
MLLAGKLLKGKVEAAAKSDVGSNSFYNSQQAELF